MKSTKHPTRIALAALAALGAAMAPFPAAAGGEEPRTALPAYAGWTTQLIVKYRDNAEPSAIGLQKLGAVQARAGVALKTLRTMGGGERVLQLDKRMRVDDVEQIAADLEATDPDVEWAEPDYVLVPMLTPNDPGFPQQWHYHEATAGINAPAAWDLSTGTGVNVAVIDTGVLPHADLVANLLPGFDFVRTAAFANDGTGRDNDAGDPGDFTTTGECGTDAQGDPEPPRNQRSSWHGTHVAGTVAAVTNNGSGVAGVAFNAKVLPLRALAKCGGLTSDIADAIRWAAGGDVNGVPPNTTPARVINLSLGGNGRCSNASQSAIDSARSRGAVVVVAAGNEAQDAANVQPASCRGVVVVAAVGRDGRRAGYSNFGANVDVAAPGGAGRNGVLSTVNAGATIPAGDAFSAFQGTSMATPHVAGIVALMLAANPNQTPDQIEQRLEASARPFQSADQCPQCGTGLADAAAAVRLSLAALPQPAPPPAPPAPPPEPEPTPPTPPVGGPAPGPAQPPATAQGDDDGGGALGVGWLVALLVAVCAAWAARVPRRRLVPVRVQRQPRRGHD